MPDWIGPLQWLAAAQQAVSAWLRRRRRRGDDDAFARALLIELAWLTKEQRAELAALAPARSRKAPSKGQPPLPDNVIDFEDWHPDRALRYRDRVLPEPPARESARRRWRSWALAGLAVLLLLSVGSVFLPLLRPAAEYSSGVGERRNISLPDGSAAMINTQTRIRVRYTHARRDIDLLEGEAYFSVAHDPTRPFRVLAGRTVVEALGTAFDVYLAERDTRITVTQGQVRVNEYEAAATTDWLSIREHQKAFVKDDHTRLTPLDIRVRPVMPQELRRDLAWTQDEIEFSESGTSLSEAVSEFNRYNRIQLLFAEPDIADIEVGGRFRKDAVADFITDLELTLRVRASTASDSGILLSRGRSGSP